MPKIIPAMQIMNYQPNKHGVCFGLAAMSAKAAIRKNAQSFAQRIELIHNSNDNFLATIKKEKQIELQSFFDELSIYQGPDGNPEFSTIFPDLHQDIANLRLLTPENELASYNSLEEDEKVLIALPEAKATFVNNFTPDTFTTFVQKTAAFLNEEPFSLLISESTINHATQLGFDGTKWLLTNHDEIEICDNTPKNIQNLVIQLFRVNPFVYEKQKTLSVSIVLSNFSQADLTKFENHDIDIDLITSEFDKNILFEIVLNSRRFNRVALLKALIDKIKHIDPTLNLFVQALEFKDYHGQSILFRAAANGQHELLNVLIEEIENTQLNEIIKVNLLNAKDNENRSSFYAASRKHTNTASALLHAMSKIQGHSQIQDMVSSQDIDGLSAIHMATLSGRTKMVEFILNTIDEMNICEQQKFNLITANTYKQTSALHMAIDKGYADIAKLLLNTIKQKNVPEKDKLAWISSSTSSKNNALGMAAKKGNPELAKQLFKAIDDYNIDADTKEMHKRYLLNAKNGRGMSVSMIAAIYNHVEFYRYILDFHKQLYKDSTLNVLAQRQAEGATAMYLAAENGHEKMISFLINTIMTLDISDSNKALLIQAKRYDNTGALSLAAQHGHSKIVNEILKAVFNMNLPQSKTFHLIDARNEKNASALLLAVNKGDMTTVKILVDFILSSNLTIEAKTILLTSASENFNVKSAYQHALNKGYQQIADYLKTATLKNKNTSNITAKRLFSTINDSNADTSTNKRQKGNKK